MRLFRSVTVRLIVLLPLLPTIFLGIGRGLVWQEYVMVYFINFFGLVLCFILYRLLLWLFRK